MGEHCTLWILPLESIPGSQSNDPRASCALMRKGEEQCYDIHSELSPAQRPTLLHINKALDK